ITATVITEFEQVASRLTKEQLQRLEPIQSIVEFQSCALLCSDTDLSQSEISCLENGLSFCPRPKQPNYLKLKTDIYHFERKMRLEEYLSDKSSDTSKSKLQIGTVLQKK